MCNVLKLTDVYALYMRITDRAIRNTSSGKVVLYTDQTGNFNWDDYSIQDCVGTPIDQGYRAEFGMPNPTKETKNVH